MSHRRGLTSYRHEDEARVPFLVSLPDRSWLWLFVIGDLAGVAIAGALPGWQWLPFIVNAVSGTANACFCYAGLRKARPDARLIWAISLVAVLLLVLPNFYQFFTTFAAEADFRFYDSRPAESIGAYNVITALSAARTVLLLFLFSQIEHKDDTSYFRWIDIAQSILIVGLTVLVFQSGLLGGHQYSIPYTRWLGSVATQLTVLFGVMNWLSRAPGEARQLIGAINLYFFAKVLANLTAQLQGGFPSGLVLASYSLADAVFVMTVLYARRNPEQEGTRSALAEALRFYNPALFTVTAMGLALVVDRIYPLLGKGLGLLSVMLYVLRSARWHTEYRHLQAQTAEVAQARTDFLLDVSHEIRSPLTTITLNAARLHRETRLTADQAALTRTIHKGAELVLSTLNDILDISQLESGQLRIPLGPFDALPVIDETADLLEPQARHRKVTIEWRQASLPHLLGNAERLRQVLINILSNAIRHAPENSKIVITVEEERSDNRPSARIMVTDFGQGIPADQQALLFRRFSQLGPHAAGNSGLGLAISNSLVKLMEGKIGFDSKPGQTSFWVELPTVRA